MRVFFNRYEVCISLNCFKKMFRYAAGSRTQFNNYIGFRQICISSNSFAKAWAAGANATG